MFCSDWVKLDNIALNVTVNGLHIGFPHDIHTSREVPSKESLSFLFSAPVSAAKESV